MTSEADVGVAQPGLFRRYAPYWQIAAQVAFAAALLGLLLWRVDVAAVRDDLRGANLWWLPLAFAANIASDFFRAVRWGEFFRPMKRVGVVYLWGVAVLGVACNLALPLRAGEFVRLQLLRRKTGLRVQQILATILSEKLMDTVAFSLFLVVGILLYEEAHFLWPLLLVYVAVLIAGVWGARWLSRRAQARDGIEVPAPSGARGWLAHQLNAVGAGMHSFQSPRALAVVSVSSILAWLCEATMYYAAGRALGLDIDPAVYLLVVVAATVAVSVPLTQAGLGVFEIALTGLLVAFGVSKSEAAAFAIFSHVMLALPYFLLGPLTAVALRITPGDLFFLRQAPAVEG